MQRNPFSIQTSEQASTEEQFVSLFGAEALDVLPQNGLWDRLVILEAAPGAGKSTILRLFTPDVLKELHRNRDRQENLEVIGRLETLGAMSPDGLQIIGSVVSCRGQYASIDDLNLTTAEKQRWFFGLLDARIALLTLKAYCVYADLEFPQGLVNLHITPSGTAADGWYQHTSGLQLYEDAAARENDLATAIDSLTNQDVDRNALCAELRTLRFLSKSRFELAGQPMPGVCLTMFDDVQDLTPWQQGALVRDLQDRDVRTGRWIARRLDVLSIDELLPSGGRQGRDYECRRIEDWARDHRPRFQKLLESIADRRIRKTDLGVSSFASLLSPKLARQSEIGKLRTAAGLERDVVLGAHRDETAYAEWVSATMEEESKEPDAHLDNAVRWRALDILTHRQRRRRIDQPVDQPRPSTELFHQRGPDVMSAAELLVAVAHDIPFYYGLERLIGLASANVEQFLRIGGAVFDKLLLLQVVGRRNNITATEQDAIARLLANAAIEALPRDVPHGPDVQRLVVAIGTYAKEVTTRESASYSPGVLGVGLKQSQFSQLLDSETVTQHPELHRLRDTLKACIAHNILEARGPKSVKGDLWMVFYLNRLLSPAFELPVVSSQFQGIGMADMLTWLTYGYRSPSRQDRLLL